MYPFRPKFAKTLILLFTAPSFLLAPILFSACTPNPGQGNDNPENKDLEVSKKMEAVTDVDGQVYKIIEIGDQVWMAENLRKTTFECDSNVQVKFTNGIERGPGVAFYDGKPRYAYYQNNPNLGFGVIYSFGALQHCKLCPPGFRIPTKADWELLVSELGGKSVAGMALLPGGKSGFKAEMGGRIDAYGSGMAGSYGFWWSSEQGSIPLGNSEVYNFGVTSKGIVIISSQDSRVGIYVRCIKE